MAADDYGFEGVRKKRIGEKLAQIKPSDTVDHSISIERVDAIAGSLGFTSREPNTQVIRRRRRDIGPTMALNIRPPVAVGNKFIEFCEKNRFSYWEGIDYLLKNIKETGDTK